MLSNYQPAQENPRLTAITPGGALRNYSVSTVICKTAIGDGEAEPSRGIIITVDCICAYIDIYRYIQKDLHTYIYIYTYSECMYWLKQTRGEDVYIIDYYSDPFCFSYYATAYRWWRHHRRLLVPSGCCLFNHLVRKVLTGIVCALIMLESFNWLLAPRQVWLPNCESHHS